MLQRFVTVRWESQTACKFLFQASCITLSNYECTQDSDREGTSLLSIQNSRRCSGGAFPRICVSPLFHISRCGYYYRAFGRAIRGVEKWTLLSHTFTPQRRPSVHSKPNPERSAQRRQTCGKDRKPNFPYASLGSEGFSSVGGSADVASNSLIRRLEDSSLLSASASRDSSSATLSLRASASLLHSDSFFWGP